MKDYSEIMEHLYERRDAYYAKKAERIKRVKRMGAVLSGFVFLILLGAGMYQFGNVSHLSKNQMEKDDALVVADREIAAESMEKDEGISAGNDVSKHYRGKLPSEILSDYAFPESAIEDKDENYASDSSKHSGVRVPVFIAFDGYLYQGRDCDISSMHLLKCKTSVKFNADYILDTYEIEEEPEWIALIMNGGFQVYEKAEDLSFAIDSVSYKIVYNVTLLGDEEEILGDLVEEKDKLKIYDMKTKGGSERNGKAYIVNISELLMDKYPQLFNSSEDFEEYWWVAYPQ